MHLTHSQSGFLFLSKARLQKIDECWQLTPATEVLLQQKYSPRPTFQPDNHNWAPLTCLIRDHWSRSPSGSQDGSVESQTCRALSSSILRNCSSCQKNGEVCSFRVELHVLRPKHGGDFSYTVKRVIMSRRSAHF